MANNELTIESFGGNDIQSATYNAYFAEPTENVFDNPPYSAVVTQRPEAFPVHSQGQPLGKRLVIEVQILSLSKANIEQLKKWFDPYYGEQYLVATDGDSVQRRILCFPEELHWKDIATAVITLAAPVGLWENVTATTATANVVTSGGTFAVSNPGDAVAYPSFTINPQVNRPSANAPIRRRYVTIVNKSPEPLSDPIGDGYPVDITNDGFDTAAEVTATQMQADGDDLRAWLNSEELHRWLDGVNTTTTKVWCNLRLQGRKTFTLKAAFASGASPAAGATFEVSNADGLAGWLEDTAVLIESEVVRVTRLSLTEFEVVQRGARGTTAAAHSAGTTGYWVEHSHLVVTYDNSAATSPAPPDDRKPVIDLATSTNAVHEWPSPFFNASDRRSRAFQRQYTEDDPTSDAIRLYESGGTMIFEDLPAAAGKPRYNNALIACPVPIDDASAAVELDYTVETNMLLHGYLLDLEGHESSLFKQKPTSALTNQQHQPAAVANRFRLYGRIGNITGWFSGTTPNNNSLTIPSTTDTAAGFRFVLSAPARITGIAIWARESSAGTANLILRLRPDSSDAPHASLEFNQWTILDASLVTDFALFYLENAAAQPYIELPAGTYWIALDLSAASGEKSAARAEYRAHAQMYTRQNSANEPQYSPELLVLTDVSEPQSDAYVGGGDQAIIDNVKLTYASEYVPGSVIGAEENCYFYDFRLKNDTTGDYLDIRYPGFFNASTGKITIDCENRRITDDLTGEEIPFALIEASNPEEWLPLRPGSNTISYTETGITDIDIPYSFRGKWL